MDRDKLVKEIEKLQELLSKIEDKDGEKYLILAKRLSEHIKMLMEFDETCDKQNERLNKYNFEQKKFDKNLEFEREKFEKEKELEREKFANELELKRKELEAKMEFERYKYNENTKESAARRKAEKRQAIWDIIKLLVQIIGSGILIAFTGKIEQTVILGQHKWSWIQAFGKGKV